MGKAKKSTDKEQAASPSKARSEQPIEAYFGTAESKTPGRTRIRIKRELRTPEAMAQIQEQLSKHENVQDVTINPRTGSVVIKHDAHRDGHEVFKEALKDVELVGSVLLDVPVGDGNGDENGGGGEYGKLDQTLANLVYKMDKAVYKRTGLRFRGQILAGTVAGLGILQIAIVGISIEMLPGPVLLYIAYDIYHRESKEPPFDAADDVAPETTGEAAAPAPAA